jgi:2-keto-4-pentenoate hydratase/2-oxohepta-3-ene-1,7-dioic acid hydratase in catechol pathway
MRWSTYISPADGAGSDLDPRSAEEHIAGFMVMCDWSARDLQRHEMLGNLGPANGTEAYPWLQPGDTVRLEVAELGVIESAIVPGPPVIPLR